MDKGVFPVGGALLEMCVMAALKKQDMYGYSLTQKIQRTIPVSESTLYPVLRRLKKAGLLETRDEMQDGRNRRYYMLTEQGSLQLKAYQKEWKEFAGGISALLEEGFEDE